MSSHKYLILAIDHDIDALKHLGACLKGLGDIIFATSGEAGMHLAETRKPDLIIASWSLPDLAGAALCQRLKNRRDTSNCSLIIVAAPGTDQQEVTALEAGAVDFILKPYREPVLRARIKAHLNVSHYQNLLQVLADRDGLTEVYNRRYFDCQSRIELKRHYRQQQPMTLALLDIDHFKVYNDTYGHLQGDACLREVAQAIAHSSRRPAEFVARYGGEEFAVILPNTSTKDAKKYGHWICEQIHSLAIPNGRSPTIPFVTISAGIATTIPTSQTNMDNLIATADSALYLAKESGRNQFKMAHLEREIIQEAG